MKNKLRYLIATIIIVLPIAVFIFLQSQPKLPDTKLSYFKAISPNNEFLIYDTETEIKIYNLETKKTNTLTTLDEKIEGLRCIRNENNTDIACVSINQQDYPGLTKITILEIDNEGNLINQKDLLQEKWESVDYVCGANCYPWNFRFTKEKTVKYDGHNIIAPDKIFEISY